jgi:hypothetical protein
MIRYANYTVHTVSYMLDYTYFIIHTVHNIQHMLPNYTHDAIHRTMCIVQ